MEIIELSKNVTIKEPLSLALGFFDGIHRAHRHILETARDIAREKGYKSGILTFRDHPVEKLRPGTDFHYLTTLEERIRLVESIGIDYFIILPFDKDTIETSPEDFIKKILLGSLNTRAAVVGCDYHFGYKAQGSVQTLKEMMLPYGVEVIVIESIKSNSEKLGSTAIREAILRGSIDEANMNLGRWYSLEGTVRVGNQRGKKLGIPTANIDLPKNKVIPPEGVYCFFAIYKNKLYKAVGSVGGRPTFGEYSSIIEIHLLDFDGDIYGEKIRVFFVQKIRDIIKFENPEDLIAKIRDDIKFCREFLGNIPSEEIERNISCCPAV